MKLIFTIILLSTTSFLFGQDKTTDFENLVRLGEIYSKNVNTVGDGFRKSVEALKTPNLNHIIDALIAVGKGDSTKKSDHR